MKLNTYEDSNMEIKKKIHASFLPKGKKDEKLGLGLDLDLDVKGKIGLDTGEEENNDVRNEREEREEREPKGSNRRRGGN